MKKTIAGIVAATALALSGGATADCLNCDGYDVNLNVNGTPFYGKWAIVDDRPYVAVEAFADALGSPRRHYYKAWSVGEKPSTDVDPLELMSLAESSKVNTIRFAGLTMMDLYAAAEALDLDVHHNFNNRTIQVGDNYHGQRIKGANYRYLSRARGWTHRDMLGTWHRKHMQDYHHDHFSGRRL